VERQLKRGTAVTAAPEPCSSSVVPGTQAVWVKTFGCSHNHSDGEYMAGQLQAFGYRLVRPTLTPSLRRLVLRGCGAGDSSAAADQPDSRGLLLPALPPPQLVSDATAGRRWRSVSTRTCGW
jgi:hypothetical protein